MQKVTPFLMFADRMDEAIALYTRIFPDSKVESLSRAGGDGPLTSAHFTVGGQSFMAFQGGSYFHFSEGFSIHVDCADQAEVDRYWDALVEAGARPSQCGWITDPFGLTWQIVPRRFTELVADPDGKKVKAVVAAMMTMQKLDVAALQDAYDKA